MSYEQELLQKRLSALLTVQDIAQELMSELDSRQLLRKILDAAIKVLDASAGSLLIWVPPNELEWAVSANPALVGQRMPADKGISGWVFTNEEPLIVGDVKGDSRFFREVDPEFDSQSLIAVPLMTPTERIGVVLVLNKRSGEEFDEQDRDILATLSAQAATAIVNARLYQELQEEKNRLIEMEDQLNRELARDLHDGPAQTLAAIMMDIEFILRLYDVEPERLPYELLQLRQAAAKTLAQIRNTMFELRPVILETQGLEAALRSYVERLNSTEGMNIHLDIRRLDSRLPSRIERLCFAIVKEAVSNVKKHAYAENTWIVVERRSSDLIIAVRDDGDGFNVAEVKEGYDTRGSMGLLNMEERAELLSARYGLQSVPGQGTLVSLIVPLASASEPGPGPVTATGQGNIPSRDNGRRRPGTGPLAESEGVPVPAQMTGKRRKGTGPLGLVNNGDRRPDGADKAS
jgi:signal transduction histidine kinase